MGQKSKKHITSMSWASKVSLVLIFAFSILLCGMVQSAYAVRTITVTDATGPSNFYAAKGSTSNYTDAFQVTTSGTGAGVTLNTVYITTSGTANLTQVAVEDATGATSYGSQTTPSGNVWAVTINNGTGGLGNNPTATLRIYIDVASGATTGATFTAYVSSFDWTSGTGTSSTDAVSTTVTILAVPTVTSPTASNVASTSATLGANVTSNGGATLTAKGICWDLTSAPTANCPAQGTTGTGIFTQTVSSLNEGSLIYYRGYATNPATTGYSSDGTIYTEPTQPNSLSFSNVTSSGMTVNWSIGSTGNAAQVIVLMKSGSAVNGNPVDGTTYTDNANFGSGSVISPQNYVVYKGSGTSVNVTGLSASTTYYVQINAFAAGAGGTENYNTSTPPTGSQATSSGGGGGGGGMSGSDAMLHNSINTGSTKWAANGGWGWGTSKYGAFICDTCHTPRAVNIKGVEKYMVTPDTRWGTLPGQWKTIVFSRAQDGSSDFGDDSATRASSSRVCEICHTYNSTGTNGVKYHGYNMTTITTHNNKTDCTKTCHLHNQGFKAAGCDSCHGEPPIWDTASGGPYGLSNNAATGSKTAGKHNTHWYSLGFACTTCHNGYAMDGAIDVNFSYWGWATGSYTGQSGVTYNFGAGTGTLTCSNIYCHGQTLTGGADTTPAWNSTATGNCGNCHGATQSNPPTAGNHQRHTNTGYVNLACSKCHPNVVDNDGHVNGSVAWKLDTTDPRIDTQAQYDSWNTGSTGTLAPSSGYGPCTNLYCHSNGSAGSPPYNTRVTPYWGSSVLDTTCTGCHYGNYAETYKMQSGSHTQHVQTNRFDCVKCHSATVSGWRTIINSSLHVNKLVNIDFDNYNTIGRYNGLSTMAKTPGTAPLACTNLYCHSSAQGDGGTLTGISYATAVWGSSSTGDCGTCHGADGSGKGWWLTTGSHFKHIAAPNSFVCDTCHSGAGANYELRHADKLIWISFSGGGSYGAGASHAPGNGYNTCSGVSCHGSGTPMWGSSGSALCGTCHNVNSNLLGQHSNHWATVGNASGWYSASLSTASTYMFGCGLCHATPPSKHAGGWVSAGTRTAEVNFSGLAGSGTYAGGSTSYTDVNYKYTNGTCTSTYCHGDGNGGAPKVTAFDWQTSNGAFATPCSFCHGGKTGAVIDTSRHGTHWSTYRFSCENCHNSTTLNGTSINDRSQHVDGTKDVAFNAWVSYNGAPSWSNNTCATTYCHSAGGGADGRIDPLWTSIPTGDCGNCHGATATTMPWSTRHAQHVANNPSGGQGYKFACAKCHYRVVTSTTDSTIQPSISTFGLHVNKTINVDFDPAWGSNGTFTFTAGQSSRCTNIYCHSDGTTVATGSAWTTGFAIWSTTYNCNGCHGDEAGNTGTGAPWYTSYLPKANSHMVDSHQVACSECHYVTTSNGSNITSFSRHANRVYDVVPNVGNSRWFTYAFRASGSTCGGISCHNNGFAVWGSSGSATCGSCHAVNNTLAGQHSNHWATAGYGALSPANLSVALTYQFSCGVCHLIGTYGGTVTHSGGAVSASQTAEISFWKTLVGNGWFTPGSLTYADGTFNYTNSTCGTYCHSNGNGGNPKVTAFNWQTSNGAFATPCSFCHGGKTSAVIDTSRHGTHWSTYRFSCENCHVSTTLNGTSIADKSQHVDGTKDVAFNAWVSYSGAPSWSNNTCANTYCHSAGGGADGRIDPLWTSIPTGDCGKCHGADATTMPWSTRHAQHVANNPSGGQGYKFACATCHYATVTMTADSTTQASISTFGLHVNKVINVDFNPAWGSRGGTATVNGGQSTTCTNIYCHSDGTTVAKASPWATGFAIWSTTYNCNGCHGDEAGNPGTGAPWYTSYLPKANSHQKHLATHAEYNCSDCHFVTAGTNGTSITSFSRHVNKSYDVTPSTVNSRWFTYGFSANGSTCGGISCHGGSAAIWGSSGSANMACGGCHAVNNTLAGQHSNHWATARFGSLTPANQSSASTYQFSCGVCHLTTDNGGAATHQGGQVSTFQKAEISFWKTLVGNGSYAAGGIGYLDSTTSWNYTNGTCSSIYCHSDGNGGNPNWVTFNWQTSYGRFANNPCAFCHKGTRADGAGNWMTSGSHSGHVGWATMGCAWCHAVTARGLSGYGSIYDRTNHVDGMVDIEFWTTAKNGSSTYAGSATPVSRASNSSWGACANVTCHGSGTPQWGTMLYSTTVLCDVCHGGPSINYSISTFYSSKTPKTMASSDSAVGAHTAHLGGLTYISSGVIGCDDCHKVPSGVFDAGHFDTPPPANLTWGTLARTSPVTTPSYAQGGSQACYVYCHRGPEATTGENGSWRTPFWTQHLIWNSVGVVGNGNNTRGTGDCAVCHAYPPMDNGQHLGKTASQCSGCHTHVNATGTGFTDLTKHINGKVEAAGAHDYPWSTHGMTGSCGATGTGCHVQGTSSSPYPAATLGDPPDCMGCHKKANATAAAACGSCHGTGTGGAPNGSTAPDRQGRHNVGPHSPCSACHGASSGAQNIYGSDHGRGNRNKWPAVVNLLSSIGYNSSTGKCTITCGGTNHGASSFSSTWY